jgi:hypothetical protein
MHAARLRPLALAALLAFASTGAAADAGRIKTAAGNVSIERAGKAMPATVGMTVQEKDRVVTGADGSVGVSFTDGTLLSAGPNSRLDISRYAYDPDSGKGALEADLRRGTLAAVSGRMVKKNPESLKIRTPSAIMGVRGTEFVVEVADAQN